MRFFGLLFGGGVAALHLYLALNLARAFKSRLWQAAVGLALAAFLLVFFFRRRLGGWTENEHVVHAMFAWIGFLLVVGLFLAIRDAAELAAIAIDAWRGTKFRTRLSGPRTIPLALLAGTAAFCYSLYEADSVWIIRHEVRTDKLPPGVDGIRLAVLTDLHITDRLDLARLDGIVDMTNAQRPDMTLLVGDYLDGRLGPDGPHAMSLRRLEGALGRYAVLGNHELYSGLEQSATFIRGAGFALLRGEADNGGAIAVVGVDDPQVRERVHPVEALRKADADKFVLLLSHRPEAPAGSADLFDLQVCGHTHGGQIWPWRYLTWALNGFGQGFTPLPRRDGGQSLVYVSNGTRYWGPPVRFLTPPEITIVDIVRK